MVQQSHDFVGKLISYSTKELIRKKYSLVEKEFLRITLIYLSPMSQLIRHKITEEEAKSFDADLHLCFFRDIFPIYGLTFDSWCVCLISDNSAVKVKIARLCQKSLVGCINRKLNLDVSDMIARDSSLSMVINSIHSTMKGARNMKN